MSEKPILFSIAMVQAILDGRKTVTRRVIKPQPQFISGDAYEYDGQVFVSTSPLADHIFHEVYGVKGSPYGGVYGDGTADELWVRETWAASNGLNHQKPSEIPTSDVIRYKADCDKDGLGPYWVNRGKWRPSIFMPRWASRIQLTITDVRVERLQDITEHQAFKEGVLPPSFNNNYEEYKDERENYQEICPHAVHTFKALWNNINAKRGYPWESNPVVWVIEFKVKD